MPKRWLIICHTMAENFTLKFLFFFLWLHYWNNLFQFFFQWFCFLFLMTKKTWQRSMSLFLHFVLKSLKEWKCKYNIDMPVFVWLLFFNTLSSGPICLSDSTCASHQGLWSLSRTSNTTSAGWTDGGGRAAAKNRRPALERRDAEADALYRTVWMNGLFHVCGTVSCCCWSSASQEKLFSPDDCPKPAETMQSSTVYPVVITSPRIYACCDTVCVWVSGCVGASSFL